MKKLKTVLSVLFMLLSINSFLLFSTDVFAVCSPTPTISGPDNAAAPGTYQYTVNNAQGEIRWCVTGVGVSIDATGLVTVNSGACGSFTVSATDAECGQIGSKDARITNNGGSWQMIYHCD